MFVQTESGGVATMAKPRGRPRSDRDDITVKVGRDVAEKAKLVALRRRITLAEYLTELLRGPVERAYKQEVRNLSEEGGE